MEEMKGAKGHDRYLQVLREELIPALGCTEPIAIAYGAAKARAVLGVFPEKIMAVCSGNVIKNVKGVIVPTTGNMKGIETSAILGALAGNADKKLEVLSEVTSQDIEKTKGLLGEKICEVALAEGVENLYIKITVSSGQDWASVTISDGHTNITEMVKNGEVIYQEAGMSADGAGGGTGKSDRGFLTLKGIYDFVNQASAASLKSVLQEQVDLNSQIAEEGMTGDYGANVGKTLLKTYGERVENLAKAYASAGSDARMSGCVMPVVINSGSGNQGLTVSLPVVVYAKELQVSEEKLYRALALSNLVSIYIKSQIGKLSAYCGAVSASCGSGAAIAYLHDAGYQVIADTIVNTLANTSGIVCDGAKASCAAKIASSVDAAIMGYHMASKGNTFHPGDGLVKEDVDKTIASVCRMAKHGMKETDVEILKIMI